MLMNRINKTGLRLTPQRDAILKFLERNDMHPSADEIYAEIKKIYPGMSFATVYNTLQVLKERGNVQEITIDQTRKRFDPDMRPHHHMICVNCKKISDIHLNIPLDLSEKVKQGFKVLRNHIEFYGICPGCVNNYSEDLSMK